MRKAHNVNIMVAEPHSDRPSFLLTLGAVYAAGWIGTVTEMLFFSLGPTSSIVPEEQHDTRLVVLGLAAAFGAAALPLFFETLTGFHVSYVSAAAALASASVATYLLQVILGFPAADVLLSPATPLWVFIAAAATRGGASRALTGRHF